jgi:3-oxoacyl-[acyl-carrier-protein] synthase-3
MRHQRVCLEGVGYVLPDQIITTDEIEHRLQPLYARLKLPAGRLEAMTGIAARRFWPEGVLPSQMSILSGRHALEAAEIDPGEIGALIHASVCRDHLEPATACAVHHALGLPAACMVYDVSNACLGLLNGALQIANMIELGQIRAGLVVGSEGSRQLVEHTIASLNSDPAWTRRSVKSAIASLTIGSGSCAFVLADASLSQSGSSLIAATVRAETRHHQLCQSGADEAGAGMQPLMDTDSEALMREGVTFEQFLFELACDRAELDRTVCHQVGAGHRKLMLETLGLPLERDYETLSWLGNTGSVALPLTLASAAQTGFLQAGHRVGLLGIGSGVNCIMAAIDWGQTHVRGEDRAEVGRLQSPAAW